ncbi:MAG: purine-nucleoside phosphorylase [Gemmatimonadota bacterium]|jgi:purine-nucleoside phosphorylase
MTPEQIEAAREALAARIPGPPGVHVVLGSGLSPLADSVAQGLSIPFEEIPGLPVPTVASHQGRFVVGTLEGMPVLIQAGRFHLYEGHEADMVAAPVRLGRALGAHTLVVTNAAGGIRAGLVPGSLVLIRDHLNLQGRSPLTGPVRPGEGRFPDMTEAYDGRLRHRALEVAARLGLGLTPGVYAGLSGPAFETPAEIEMLARLGADVVGMSTVPEVLAARAGGMRCLGLSLVTNLAAGRSRRPLSHQEVMEVAGEGGTRLEALVRGVLARMAEGE